MERIEMKNHVHAYLLMNNIPTSARPFTKAFVEEMKYIVESDSRTGATRILNASERN